MAWARRLEERGGLGQIHSLHVLLGKDEVLGDLLPLGLDKRDDQDDDFLLVLHDPDDLLHGLQDLGDYLPGLEDRSWAHIAATL